MTDSTAHVTKLTHTCSRGSELAPGLFGLPPNHHPDRDHSGTGMMSPVFGQLVAPTWIEAEEARHRYDQDAKRLRYWRWWFVGMFTFYTALAAILLFQLVTGL